MSTLPPGSAPPPAAPSGTDHDALPPGTRFGEFEIIRVLGVGGFGIVYLANDHSLEREVALKEYMPASLAARGLGPQITVRSSSFAETYAIGLRSFVNEARLLARFDHPSLVKVYRFWEDNATAYMVMPFLQGVTLRDTRRRMAHPPDEAWIRSVITPILSALELLHREGVYHRDIAPDNILLPPDGPPVLLDFGAARRVISDRTQSLTAILKPSYAPIEQYAEMTQLRQGPWTDLYALGAVIHYLLFGAPPAPATARAVQDDAEQIENRIVPGVSPRFLEAVSWMLAIRPNQRPQNGEQLRAVLDGNAAIPPRGRPGITIPPVAAGAPAPAGQTYAPTRAVERPPENTLVPTAHMPTYLPTAHVPPPGQQRPTTFSPTAQMPSPRAAPSQFDAPSVAPPVNDWPASRPATLPPPRPGATAPFAAATMPPMSRPEPLSRPVPLAAGAAANAMAATAATSAGSSKLGLVIAGLAAVVLIGAAAAWQFGGKQGGVSAGPSTDAATGNAGVAAPAVLPATTSAVPATALPTVSPTTTPAIALPTTPAREAPPLTANALVKPNDSSAASAASPRSATTTTRNDLPTALHNDASPGSALPRSQPLDRNATGIERNVSSDRSALATDPNGTRVRPTGRPVPRLGDADAATATTGATQGRLPDTFGSNPSANTSERPRPLGSPVQREPILTGRPVPQQQQQLPPQLQPQPQRDAQPASAREACGKRVFIALAVCMDDRCEEPRFRTTAECVGILERKHARENR